MKIALISAVLGGFETHHSHVPQTGPYDLVDLRITDHSYPFPRADLPPRLRAKYWKTQAHSALPGYDAYVWVDGSIQITHTSFVEWLVSYLRGHTCAFFPHPDRDCIYDEAAYCQHGIQQGNLYLGTRYGSERMIEQVNCYRKDGYPAHHGLLAGGVFVRLNEPVINRAFDQWWMEQIKWTIQDQLSLPYVLWKAGLRYSTIPGSIWESAYHRWAGHKQPDGSIEPFR